MAKISIFGTGYVGLIAGACFAKYNNDVICVDVDEEKINMLKQGKSPIYEPGLEELLNETITNGNIEFTLDAESAIKNSDIHFICVGTPTQKGGTKADLSYVFQVVQTIGQHMDHYAIIVDKSTVPVGTGRKVNEIIQKTLEARGVGLPYDVVSNPEFLREGSSVEDFLIPDRVVIGTESKKAQEIMSNLYKPFTRNGNPIILTDKIESAEMIKYAANTFLATKIAFINELAEFCEVVGADIREVAKGMGTDSRISPKFMRSGPGYGGSCFPKDTNAFVDTSEEVGAPLTIVKRGIGSNEEQKQRCAAKIVNHYQGDLEDKTIGVWGLAFKANTDDMRESSAITIINYLLEKGAKIKVHDFKAMENAKKIFGERVAYCDTKEEVLQESDALVVLTEWNEYRFSDLGTLVDTMQPLKDQVVFDFRNLFEDYKDDVPFKWYGLGITQ